MIYEDGQTGGSSNLRDSTDAWRSLTQSSLYDTSPMGFYPYGGYGGLDLNARRKNATRESTNTLKAWLHEHIKNPYPTKGEKIMLAIITKMTLTQVSTWFANARRRLKKENKMTWSPRNRSEDGDDDDDDDEGAAGDEPTKGTDKEQQEKEKRLSNVSEDIDVDGNTNITSSTKCPRVSKTTLLAGSDSVSPTPSIAEDARSRLSPPQSRDSDSSYTALGESQGQTELDVDQQKPKIWSVTDFLHPGAGSAKPSLPAEPSSCKETGMKMDIMRCVPTSAEAAAAAVDLTGRTVSNVTSAAVHAHAAALSSARGSGFFPPMTSLSPAAQQLTSYQTALASYAAHSSYGAYGGLGSMEVNKLVMKPTATRFGPYVNSKPVALDTGFPPARDFSVLREGE
ncbi:hypothetical protein ACOMHN_046547 [Nucella lapillus]